MTTDPTIAGMLQTLEDNKNGEYALRKQGVNMNKYYALVYQYSLNGLIRKCLNIEIRGTMTKPYRFGDLVGVCYSDLIRV